MAASDAPLVWTRDPYKTQVLNYERHSKTERSDGSDTVEYEIESVCRLRLFSAMPGYSDFATKFYRKQVSDPTSVGSLRMDRYKGAKCLK